MPTASHPPRVASNDFARSRVEPIRQKDTGRLGQTIVRSDADEERLEREWLFVSQEAALRALGAPDDVDVHKDGSELWAWDVPVIDAEGQPAEDRFELTFVRGRVVDVYGPDENHDED